MAEKSEKRMELVGSEEKTSYICSVKGTYLG